MLVLYVSSNSAASAEMAVSLAQRQLALIQAQSRIQVVPSRPQARSVTVRMTATAMPGLQLSGRRRHPERGSASTPMPEPRPGASIDISPI